MVECEFPRQCKTEQVLMQSCFQSSSEKQKGCQTENAQWGTQSCWSVDKWRFHVAKCLAFRPDGNRRSINRLIRRFLSLWFGAEDTFLLTDGIVVGLNLLFFSFLFFCCRGQHCVSMIHARFTFHAVSAVGLDFYSTVRTATISLKPRPA